MTLRGRGRRTLVSRSLGGSERARLDRQTPVRVRRGHLSLSRLTRDVLPWRGDRAVAEGIAVLEGATPAEDRFIVAQDPESFVPDDVLILIVEGRRLVPAPK